MDNQCTGMEARVCCRQPGQSDLPLTAAAQDVVPVAATAGKTGNLPQNRIELDLLQHFAPIFPRQLQVPHNQFGPRRLGVLAAAVHEFHGLRVIGHDGDIVRKPGLLDGRLDQHHVASVDPLYDRVLPASLLLQPQGFQNA